MGYIDSDTHIRESDVSWDYLDPDERHHRPEKDSNGAWIIDGTPAHRPFNAAAMPPEYNALFPEGSVDLAEPVSRVRRMDELGVDVQVLFSTFWLNLEVPSPEQEAALMRSWNRWVADRVAESKGRLLWNAEVPFRTTERAIAEMEFARNCGAVGVHISGLRHGITVAHELYRPIFEKAQDLDMVVSIHVGGDQRKYARDPSIVYINNLAPVAGAFHALYSMGIPAQYPNVRWAFVESGASWLPFALQESSRADGSGAFRTARDWRDIASSALTDRDFFVTCQIDDDLPYLEGLFGAAQFVHGTDYGHMDLGSDAYGLHIIASRPDIAREDARAIVDSNARRLWRIDDSFRPAPAVEIRPDIVEASRGWVT